MSLRERIAKLLRSCAKDRLIDQGLQVHAALVKTDLRTDMMLNTDLINMYAKCSRMALACSVFDVMPRRNVVSWTALMCGFLENGNAKGSLSLFCKMGSSGVEPNEFTFSINLKASWIVGLVEIGMQIHSLCARTGHEFVTVVGNAIIDMYSKCGRFKEASKMFDIMPVRNLISWNAMIAGYTLQGNGELALCLFQKMQEEGKVPDEFSLTSILKVCSELRAVPEGRQLHASLITRGLSSPPRGAVAGALVDLYVKCRCLMEARMVFDKIEQKSVIFWSSLILGYAQEGNLIQAMNLFSEVRKSGHQVDGFVLSSLLGVFADFALVEQGKQLHAYTIKIPYDLGLSVANSIVDLYLKCGLMEEAERFFNDMTEKDVVSWTVMITGYGKHGLGREAICAFEKMYMDNIEPDGVTYLALLSACSHSGLVNEGQEYFSRLSADRRIKLKVEHYACVVDLLGRAGRLKEAKSLVNSMPVKPNTGIWQTLLSACRLHGELEIGKEVGEKLLTLDGNNPVNYVMLSNVYAEAGYWKQRERIREVVKMRGLKKDAGMSWVEIDKKVHFFFNGDNTHPLTDEIHQVLVEMEKRMKEEIGFVHGVRFALHDVEEESKEESLRCHSEKLAIGLALVCGKLDNGKRMIRIFKNLRVCGDCHEFFKGLSKLLKILFVVRDASRFHRVEDGSCSCGDYW